MNQRGAVARAMLAKVDYPFWSKPWFIKLEIAGSPVPEHW